MKKKGFKRVIFIVCIVFAVVLAVVGVICINSINHTGIEQQQAEESAVLSNVRDVSRTDPLTDDQFEKGWDKIMPVDITTNEVYSQRIGVISSRLLIAIIKPTDSVVKIEPEKIVITNTVSNSSTDNNDSDYVESGGDTDETISR